MKYILMLCLALSLNAELITAIGYGSNSEKVIAKNKAFTDAKVKALNQSGVQISAELELTQHEKLNEFKEEVRSKILQKSEGLVTLVKVISTNYSKKNQIYTYTLKAKFEIEKSDIKNSFEIMKKLDSLYKTKVGQDEYKKLLLEIKNLKTKISNPQLSKIINKNTTKVINNVEVVVNNEINIENKVNNKNHIEIANKITNNTDNLLYFIIGGLLFIITLMLFLSNRKKDIVVKHIVENPTIEDIADVSKKDDEILLSLNKKTFVDGEKLILNLRVNSTKEKLFLYAYNLDTNDEVVLLKLMQFGNRIKPNKDYTFPDYADGFPIVAPYGRDIIKVFVTDEEIELPTISKSVKSTRFDSLNSKGLANPDEHNISQYDIVNYFNRYSVLQNSIDYITKEG